MNVYMYQADLYCEDCGEKIRAELAEADKAPQDPADESSYDSDDYPKGSFPNGGGEADTPNHCGSGKHCLNSIDDETGLFLENPLTAEGKKYVQEHVQKDQGDGEVSSVWADFYDIPYLVSIDARQERCVKDAAAEHFRAETVFEHGQWWVKLGPKTFAVVDTNDGIDFEEV